MNKFEKINRLIELFGVSHVQAEDALKANDWVVWMAAGDIRDELASQ